MYELDGEEVTLEFLQGKAQEYDMDIDSYIEKMKTKGLVEVEKKQDVAEEGAIVTSETTAPESGDSPSEDFSLGLKIPKKESEQKYYEGTRFKKSDLSFDFSSSDEKISHRQIVKNDAYNNWAESTKDDKISRVIDLPEELSIVTPKYDTNYNDQEALAVIANKSISDPTPLKDFFNDYYSQVEGGEGLQFKEKFNPRGGSSYFEVVRKDGSSYKWIIPRRKNKQLEFIKDVRGFLENDAFEFIINDEDQNFLVDGLNSADGNEKDAQAFLENFFNTRGHENQWKGYEVKQHTAFRDKIKITSAKGVDRVFDLSRKDYVDQIVHFLQSDPNNRKQAEEYQKDAASLNTYLDKYFTPENVKKVLDKELNLRTLEEKLDPADALLELVEDEIGGFGFFDNVRRDQLYPNMTNEDITDAVRERLNYEISSYKTQRIEDNAASFIANNLPQDVDKKNYLATFRKQKINSFTGLEQELAILWEDIVHGNLSEEDKKKRLQQYKNKALEINAYGEDYMLLINPNDGRQVILSDDKEGKRKRELEDLGYQSITSSAMKDEMRSFEFGRLEDHYNNNVLALANVNKKLNTKIVVKFNQRGFFERISDTRSVGQFEQESILSLGQIGLLQPYLQQEDFIDIKFVEQGEDGKIDVDGENFIDLNKLYNNNEDIQEVVNLVRAIQEERFDLKKSQAALDRMYLLNESPLTIEKKGVETAVKSFLTGLGMSERVASGDGEFITERTILDEYEAQMTELGFSKSEREKLYFERGFGETLNEQGFGMSGILLEFFALNKLLAPVKVFTGLSRLQKIWGADRYMRNGKTFSTSLLMKRADKAGLSLAEYASGARGFTNVGKSIGGQFMNLAVGTGMESWKFGLVMGDGLLDPTNFESKYMLEGGSFFLAGRVLNPAFSLLKTSTPAQEKLYQFLVKGPSAFTTGSEGAQAVVNYFESYKGNIDFEKWTEENFGDLDETLTRCAEHYLMGMGLGLTHANGGLSGLKYINEANTKKIYKKSYQNAFNIVTNVGKKLGKTPMLDPKIEEVLRTKDIFSKEMFDLVEKFGTKKQYKDLLKNHNRYKEFKTAYLNIQTYQGYFNPAVAEKMVKKDFASFIAEKKKKGIDLEVKVVQENQTIDANGNVVPRRMGQEGMQTNAQWMPAKDGKQVLLINVKSYSKGILPHEIGHDYFHEVLGPNAVLKGDFYNKLSKLSENLEIEEINPETGKFLTLKEGLDREFGIDFSKGVDAQRIKQWEVFSYIAQVMRESGSNSKLAEKYGHSKIGNLINSFMPGQKKFDFSTQRGLYNWLNTYIETVGKGKSAEGLIKHLEQFVDPKATQLAELDFKKLGVGVLLESKDLSTPDKSKDLFLLDKKTFDETGSMPLLYRADRFVRNEKGELKYKTKEEFQRSEDFSNFFMELSQAEGLFDNVIRQEGRRAGVNEAEMSSYVEKVKDQLIIRASNFDVSQAGGSIFGYFKNTAIPFEGRRVREKFLKEIEEGQRDKVELDRDTKEGQARIELEAKEGYFEKNFENEDISIAAQIKFKKYLKDAGLKESEAEAYLPTGKGIDVAKNLNIEAPKINLDNVDLSSYKTIRKSSNEQTGDKVAVEYFGIKPSLWEIIKSTPAKNLNKPARQSIQNKLEADVQTLIKLLPQGANDLISRHGEDITPEALKNTSSGNKKVLLQIPLLYTKTSRTGKNLAEYIKTPELIKYEKIGEPKEGTPEFEFKQSFEKRFLAEFGIGENAFKGRNLDQRLKAIMSETIAAIHNQSVRTVMNELNMPKELINRAAAGKSSALNSKTLERIAGEKSENYFSFLNEIKNPAFGNLLDRNLKSTLTPEKALSKTLVDYFSDYRSTNKEFDINNVDLRNIAKEINRQYQFASTTPEVVKSVTIKAGQLPTDLKNIDRQAGLEPSDFKLNTFEDVVEARAVTRVVTKALVEKYGDGIYEQVLLRGESGGSGVGAYADFASMHLGFGKSANRFSLHESSVAALDYMSNIKNSKGLKYTGPKKSLVEGQGNKRGQLNRLIDKKTGEWSETSLNEAFEVGEFNKAVLKDAVEALRTAYGKGEITHNQARAWVEIHGGPMSGLIKLSGSFSVVPNMSVKQMYKLYGSEAGNYVLEHTTPAQYVKARVYDYIINGGQAKKAALDATLKDYYTTLIPEKYDVMVNKTLQMDLPSWHTPGMDPIASRYYEASHPADFAFGLKNFKTGKVYDHHPNLTISEKQRIQQQIKNQNIKLFPKSYREIVKGQLNSKDLADMKDINKALELGRLPNKKSRGMSAFDFDETLIDKGKNFILATKDGKTVKITSGEWPIKGPELAEQGYKFDFTDFVNVRGGVEGPLFTKFKQRLEKFGPDNMYILTARPAESALAIHGWLKSKGVEIPLENITGLGNSTGEAKAIWMLKKFSEGYNDMYFVDDALPNVKAVRDVLNQLDIKSDVQQALNSKDLSAEVNNLMEHSLGIKPEKRFTRAEAAQRGKDAKRRRFFVPDRAADLELLLEPLYGKGAKGIENQKWFQENLIRPWERGINAFNTARQAIVSDYSQLRKDNKNVVKKLGEQVEGTSFTHDQALRIYIWNKNGFKIPDLAASTQQKLVKYVTNNPELQAYAENVAKLTKIETGLKEPSVEWWGETIASEINDIGRGIGRKKYIQDFIDIKNEIFSEENFNKMESKLGKNWRETLEDMFDRMETGRTRSTNIGKEGAALMNYLNGSVGTIMNFNSRSATLQLISTANFINSSFNNPLRAGQAFANQPQYWKDFMYIINSDALKQRRQGLEINVTEKELADAARNAKNPARAVLAKILKVGYLPTKVADSFAIASGGATFYRNAIRKYKKEGLSEKEAESKAWIDFLAISERTQQSSRADLLSAQQTGFAGRLILSFANTPMQMNRLMVKKTLDLTKGRYQGFYGENSFTEKAGQIGYYGFMQTMFFAGLQSGAFALFTNSDDDQAKQKAKTYALESTFDSFLRGQGLKGAVTAGLAKAIKKFYDEDAKKYGRDYSEVGEALLNISPMVGSKFSKLDAAGNTYNYNRKVIEQEGFTLNGPAMEATTLATEALLNIPVNRVYKKANNLLNAADDSYYNWQRVLSAMGWSTWGLGPGKDESRIRVKKKGKPDEYEIYLTEEGVRREKVEEQAKKEAKEEKKKNQQQCSQIKTDGERCKIMVNKPKTKCHYHD